MKFEKMRVWMTPFALQQGFGMRKRKGKNPRAGTLIGIVSRSDGKLIKVLVDGCKHPVTWHKDFWTPVFSKRGL